ncbi:MAG: hypothetical protein GC159_00515 [Phycisphaera sp.]|nr:hypothetical protein [Phycisphaera sp.]
MSSNEAQSVSPDTPTTLLGPDAYDADHDHVLAHRPFWVALMPVILFVGVTLIGAAAVLVMAYVGGWVSLAYGIGAGVAAIVAVGVVGLTAAMIYGELYTRWAHGMFQRWTRADTDSLREHLPQIAEWPRERIDHLLVTLNTHQQRIVTDYLDRLGE